ncbi:gamma-glutamylcysteine synthetase [Geothermobacter hydrogeniphilus]|uniref:Glutamate--cysteine ligase n=1 Tax=Geothermobacter hydrogeniphilus TaxID=1969733 RepID=A0A2K2HEW4_9BACT|nr:glutamate-cysteine ligase family protein [Geothermobacter hydrogeniphilus]PNU21826.1 gamma-glutamylcysteine synthetase [Geothermobacter hydrogeniphilus]
MSTLIKPDLQHPLTDPGLLTDFLRRGARPPEEWGVGAETEKLVIETTTGEAASWSRVGKLLEVLAAEGDWHRVHDNGHLIALLGEYSSVTLEPGGQIELSGRFCPDIHCCEGDFIAHINNIVRVAAPLGLTFLGLGVQPFTPLEKIDWLPKARYGIMGPYMAKTGDMGQRMMKQSAGLQVNLDFKDEEDALFKLRLGQALAPLLYALFANSPLLDGRPSGFLSTRGEIWRRTDPDRCGLIPSLFEPGADLQTYTEYALDVPMYFIVRDGSYIDLTGERFSFRRFLAEGFSGETATLGDWDLHLSTLFPEARLRPQVEVRSADSLPQHLTLSVTALLKGLFYHRDAGEAVLNLMWGGDLERLQQSYRDSWRLGLKTRHGRRSLHDIAREALAAAREGLRQQQCLNHRGCDETCYLDDLEPLVASGETLADQLLARWSGDRTRDLALLKEHCAFHL